jgi:hypothetical protein
VKLDSLAGPATIELSGNDGALKVADSPDILARPMGGFALAISGVALWLNWQKNERDLAALRPQVGLRADPEDARRWLVQLTVMNPRQVPMVWRTVRAVSPPGLQLISKGRGEDNETRSRSAQWEYCDFWFMPDNALTIEPGKSATWEGYARIQDQFAAPDGVAPVIEPVIDGFDQSPNRLRRIAKWIWPSAIRI